MAVFSRRSSVQEVSGGYSGFREHVRKDFSECCAYCLLHELVAGGRENFELDHFRPRFRFPELTDDFFNLYYSCHVCNLFKGSAWPTAALAELGYVFVDYCREDFSTHFRQEPDGSWTPLTRSAEYTVARLRLNRGHLLEIRLLLHRLAEIRGEAPLSWDSPIGTRVRELLAGKGGAVA